MLGEASEAAVSTQGTLALLLRKLKREENTESNMPQVLDYVQQKAEHYELERQLNAWQRKVSIAEMELKRYEGIARKGGLQV